MILIAIGYPPKSGQAARKTNGQALKASRRVEKGILQKFTPLLETASSVFWTLFEFRKSIVTSLGKIGFLVFQGNLKITRKSAKFQDSNFGKKGIL